MSGEIQNAEWVARNFFRYPPQFESTTFETPIVGLPIGTTLLGMYSNPLNCNPTGIAIWEPIIFDHSQHCELKVSAQNVGTVLTPLSKYALLEMSPDGNMGRTTSCLSQLEIKDISKPDKIRAAEIMEALLLRLIIGLQEGVQIRADRFGVQLRNHERQSTVLLSPVVTNSKQSHGIIYVVNGNLPPSSNSGDTSRDKGSLEVINRVPIFRSLLLSAVNLGAFL